jgi:hypothetical protein
MSKHVLTSWLIFLFLPCHILADMESPLIAGIFLIEGGSYQKSTPPVKIVIGVEMKADALYKLSAQGRLIAGGFFPEGWNVLSLPSVDLFQKSGSHSYILEAKSGDFESRKEIVIDVRMIPQYVIRRISEKRKKYTYTLSFLMGEKLIYATTKLPASEISLKLDLPPSTGEYNPFGLIEKSYTPPRSVSILDAAAGVYQLAKSLSKGKNKKDRQETIQKKKQITTTFKRRNAVGEEWLWKAQITLKTD